MVGPHHLNPGLHSVHMSCLSFSATSAFFADTVATKTRNEFEQLGPVDGKYSRLMTQAYFIKEKQGLELELRALAYQLAYRATMAFICLSWGRGYLGPGWVSTMGG